MGSRPHRKRHPDSPLTVACILVLACENTFTHMYRGAADRWLLGHGRPSHSEGRGTRTGVEPEQLPGPTKPASCKAGPTLKQEVEMEGEARYVGIDVSKAQVDVAVRPTGQRWVVSYDETGVEELVVQMVDLDPAPVLLEASGGLELPLVAALAAAALPVVVVNPRQVRDFARATGTLAKTDALDAAELAHFADAVRPSVRPLRDAETQVLNSLVARRHQVMTMLVSEKNRLGTAISAVRPRIEAHIAWLEQELKGLDEGLRQTLLRSPVWREKDDLLRTVPGVGEQVSLTLLAYLPELGTLDRRQIAGPGGRGSLQPGQRHSAG